MSSLRNCQRPVRRPNIQKSGVRRRRPAADRTAAENEAGSSASRAARRSSEWEREPPAAPRSKSTIRARWTSSTTTPGGVAEADDEADGPPDEDADGAAARSPHPAPPDAERRAAELKSCRATPACRDSLPASGPRHTSGCTVRINRRYAASTSSAPTSDETPSTTKASSRGMRNSRPEGKRTRNPPGGTGARRPPRSTLVQKQPSTTADGGVEPLPTDCHGRRPRQATARRLPAKGSRSPNHTASRTCSQADPVRPTESLSNPQDQAQGAVNALQ